MKLWGIAGLCLWGMGCGVGFNTPAKVCYPPFKETIAWWSGNDVSGSNAIDRITGALSPFQNLTFASSLSGKGFQFSSYGSSISVADRPDFQLATQMSVAAWVYPKSRFYPLSATLVSKGEKATSFSTFSAYDASATDGLVAKGYVGGVFDGTYLYHGPNFDGSVVQGRILRYNTSQSYQESNSWSAADSTSLTHPQMGGFFGSIYDGRFIYFLSNARTLALKYDTQGDFKSASSYSYYDHGTTDGLSSKGYWGVAFDGRYVYGVPFLNGSAHGTVLRYDTQASFTVPNSWSAYDASTTDGLSTIGFAGSVFDGRYLYFIPNATSNPYVLRYDTTLSFKSASSWNALDISSIGGLATKGYYGGVFDGRYVYLTPYSMAYFLRYDTQKEFKSLSSWSVKNLTNFGGFSISAYNAGIFDGRYVYFARTGNSGVQLRFDTTQDFQSDSSWTAVDTSSTNGLNTRGFQGLSFDGNYIYFTPTRNTLYHGISMRYDAGSSSTVFDLKTSIVSADSFSYSATGPSVQFHTSDGVFRATASTPLEPEQWHWVVGTYDGRSVNLYVDGKLAISRSASGTLLTLSKSVQIGSWGNSSASMSGTITDVQIYNKALDSKLLPGIYAGGFCRE